MRKIKLFNPAEKIDAVLSFFAGKPAEKILSTSVFFEKAGLFGLLLASVFVVILAAKVISAGFSANLCLLIMFLAVAGCIFLHYVSYTVLPMLRRLIEKTPTKLSSDGILKVLALFFGFWGVLALSFGIYSAYKPERIELLGLFLFEIKNVLLPCLFVFVFCEFWMFLMLRPAFLNVEITEETTVAEDFIGFLSLFAKGCLRFTPIVFGTVIVAACLLLANMLWSASGIVYFRLTAVAFFYAGLLPLMMYVSFLSYYFVLDLVMGFIASLKRQKRSE